MNDNKLCERKKEDQFDEQTSMFERNTNKNNEIDEGL